MRPCTRRCSTVPSALSTSRIEHKLALARKTYVHVARGKLTVNGQPLEAGDALKATGVAEMVFENGEQAEVILFDLS